MLLSIEGFECCKFILGATALICETAQYLLAISEGTITFVSMIFQSFTPTIFKIKVL